MSRGRGILSPLRLPFRHFGVTGSKRKLAQGKRARHLALLPFVVDMLK